MSDEMGIACFAIGMFGAMCGASLWWWLAKDGGSGEAAVPVRGQAIMMETGLLCETTNSDAVTNDQLQAAIDSLIEAIKIEPVNAGVLRNAMLDKLLAEQCARATAPVSMPINDA